MSTLAEKHPHVFRAISSYKAAKLKDERVTKQIEKSKC